MKLDSPEFTVSIPQPIKDEALDAIQGFIKDAESRSAYGLPPSRGDFDADFWGLIVGEERDSFFHLYVAGNYYGTRDYDRSRSPEDVRRYFVVRVDPQGVAATQVRETPE